MILTPTSGVPGAPTPGAHPDHQPRVPTTAGVPPFCSCGFVGGNGHDRPLLATHLAEVEAADDGGSDEYEELSRDDLAREQAPYADVLASEWAEWEL